MDLSKKKAKISKDILGNEIKTYKLTKEELEEYLKKFEKGKLDVSTKIKAWEDDKRFTNKNRSLR